MTFVIANSLLLKSHLLGVDTVKLNNSQSLLFSLKINVLTMPQWKVLIDVDYNESFFFVNRNSSTDLQDYHYAITLDQRFVASMNKLGGITIRDRLKYVLFLFIFRFIQ